MKKEKLIANVNFVGYRSINIECDVDRLIKTSINWLCEFRGWIKKKPYIDINDICKILNE